MTITLVRHAEVEERYHKCYNGHVDIGLSAKGYEQAEKLAEHFREEKFDGVFCSDLLRAKETLKAFSKQGNRFCEAKCFFGHAEEAIYSQMLREKSWGKHEGLSFDEIVAEGVEYKDFSQWIDALDGENYESFTQRVKEFFFEYLPSLEKERVLVITHAGVIRVFMAIVQDLTIEEAFGISLPYTSFVVYESKEKSFSKVNAL